MANRAAPIAALEQISQRRAKSLSTLVQEAIEEMIGSGELVAGDRINESALSTRLGVSRGPIREACRSLEQAGLLVSAVNQGVFVREMSLEEARDLYEVRGALAELTGRLIVQKASDAAISGLVDLVDKMDVAAEADDFPTYYSLNLAFHDALVEAAANPALAHSRRSIAKQLHLFRRRGLGQKGNLKISNREHRSIVEALVARDPVAAAEAMRLHIAGGWARMSAVV